MKAKDFQKYSIEELRNINVNLQFEYRGNDVSWVATDYVIGYKNVYNDIIITDERFHKLPKEIQNFIATHNPQGGNVNTRQTRCISCLQSEVIRRFNLGEI